MNWIKTSIRIRAETPKAMAELLLKIASNIQSGTVQRKCYWILDQKAWKITKHTTIDLDNNGLAFSEVDAKNIVPKGFSYSCEFTDHPNICTGIEFHKDMLGQLVTIRDDHKLAECKTPGVKPWFVFTISFNPHDQISILSDGDRWVGLTEHFYSPDLNKFEICHSVNYHPTFKDQKTIKKLISEYVTKSEGE